MSKRKYDFETVTYAGRQDAVKWCIMHDKKPDVPKDVVPLSVADMEFLMAPELSAGLGEFAKNTIFGYTMPGNSYYEAVMGWMHRRHGFDVKKEWIAPSPGVVMALYAAVRAYTRKTEGVIIMPPVYYPFYKAVSDSGRNIVKNPLILENGTYTIDFEGLERLAQDKNNTMLMLCNPHNPVGRVFTKKELEKVAEICLKYEVLMVVDEIHHDLIMPGYKHTVFATLSPEVAQNCVVCTAPSKTFNLAGLQASNIIIPNEEYRKNFQAEISKTGVFTLNSVGAKACEIAYNECETWLDELITVIDENKSFAELFLSANIRSIIITPLEGTYLTWYDLRAFGLDAEELEKRMEQANLFLDEGYIFGEEGAGFERLNIACPRSVLEKALNRLETTLTKP